MRTGKKVGFTGTLEGMTLAQEGLFQATIMRLDVVTTFEHGCCVGADERAEQLYIECLNQGLWPKHVLYQVTRRPPIDQKLLMEGAESTGTRIVQRNPVIAIVTYEPEDYIERNHAIVDFTQLLIAAPKELEMPQKKRGGGTWSTIRYAIKQQKPVILLLPNGSMRSFP